MDRLFKLGSINLSLHNFLKIMQIFSKPLSRKNAVINNSFSSGLWILVMVPGFIHIFKNYKESKSYFKKL